MTTPSSKENAVLGTCADLPEPHPEGCHDACDMWAPFALPAPDPRDEVIRELVEALNFLVGNPRFYDEEDDSNLWWCMLCDAEASIGNEIAHDSDCKIGKALAALKSAAAYQQGERNPNV